MNCSVMVFFSVWHPEWCLDQEALEDKVSIHLIKGACGGTLKP